MLLSNLLRNLCFRSTENDKINMFRFTLLEGQETTDSQKVLAQAMLGLEFYMYFSCFLESPYNL